MTASPAMAERYTSAVVDTCERLAHFPQRGVPRDDIRPGLRITHHKGRTIIAYVVDDTRHEVAILGIFHGGQDYDQALRPEADS